MSVAIATFTARPVTRPTSFTSKSPHLSSFGATRIIHILLLLLLVLPAIFGLLTSTSLILVNCMCCLLCRRRLKQHDTRDSSHVTIRGCVPFSKWWVPPSYGTPRPGAGGGGGGQEWVGICVSGLVTDRYWLAV